MADGSVTLPDGVPTSRHGGAAAAEGPRRLRHQRRLQLGQEGRDQPARARRPGPAAPRGGRGRRRGRGRRPRLPQHHRRRGRPGPGRRRHRRRRRRRTAAPTPSRASGSTSSSSRPTRPARSTSAASAGRPSATRSAGSSSRPAPRSPGSTTSTTTARRSTGSPARCWPRPRRAGPRGRLRRGVHPRDRRARGRSSGPTCWTSTTSRRRRSSARRRRADVRRDQDVAARLRSTSTSTSTRRTCTTAARSRGRCSGSPSWATSTRRTGRIVAAPPDFGDDKDRVVIKSDGTGCLHLRRPGLLPRQARARLRPVRHHARRRPPRLRRPDEGHVRRFGDDPARQPRDPHRPDGQPGPRRRAGADVQARRHRRHDRRPGRRDRRRRARYALARYCSDSPIDIDLDLWTRATNDNPVYYVQYAHARMASLVRNAADLGVTAESHPELLTHEKEGELLERSPSSRAWSRPPRSCASRTGSPATSRSCRHLPPVLRHLPGAAARRRGDSPTCTGPGCCSSTRPAW